jgi:hypothetical protein
MRKQYQITHATRSQAGRRQNSAKLLSLHTFFPNVHLLLLIPRCIMASWVGLIEYWSRIQTIVMRSGAVAMGEQLLVRSEGFFKRLGPRIQVALCQLPLTIIMAAIVIAAPFAWPAVLANAVFIASIVLIGLLLLACFLIPWERLPPDAYLIIPVLDLFVIGLARNGSVPAIGGLALLAIFPIIWLSASGSFSRTTIILSFFGPLRRTGRPGSG